MRKNLSSLNHVNNELNITDYTIMFFRMYSVKLIIMIIIIQLIIAADTLHNVCT